MDRVLKRLERHAEEMLAESVRAWPRGSPKPVDLFGSPTVRARAPICASRPGRALEAVCRGERCPDAADAFSRPAASYLPLATWLHYRPDPAELRERLEARRQGFDPVQWRTARRKAELTARSSPAPAP